MSASQASSRHNYCCLGKQYYSADIKILVNNMKIIPRVIIFKKSLKVNKTYESVISITNNSMYNRRTVYTTDSYDTMVLVQKYNRRTVYTSDSHDTSVRFHPINVRDTFLEPDKETQITVLIKPFEKNRINRRRHVFITCKHPNITFSIPIIIMAKDEFISVPSSVVLPPTTAQNFTYYEFIVYNKTMKKISFNFKCKYPNLAIHANSLNISRMDFVRILLKLNCENNQVLNDIIKLKFNTGDNLDIPITHVPLELSVFVDTLSIEYEAIRFNRVEVKEFRICNDSQNNIVFHADLTTEDETSLNDPDSESKTTLLSDDNDLIKPSLPTVTDSHLSETEDFKSLDKFGFRHFQVKPKCATISANSSFTVQVIFHPIMHNDFCAADDVPPFAVSSRLTLSFNNKMLKEKRQIFLNGFIDGAHIDVIPKLIDLREVYFGEENCVQIKAVNIDGMNDAHVSFYKLVGRTAAHVVVTPSEGFTLKPCQSGLFHIQFYAKVETKFMVKLQFKVKNGAIYNTIIKGNSQPVRVHCFPEILDLGVLPIAIPQKRLVLVINPLVVPISVQCTVVEDGFEVPLVLNTFNTNDPLPINVKDPVYNIQKSIEWEKEQDDANEDEHEIIIENNLEEKESSLLSFKSVVDDTSTYSSDFEEQALDLIPEMSINLVSHLKASKIFDKNEMERKVAQEALGALLKIPYFLNMDKYRNYTQMDWNTLATDPKEIYCNEEIFYLTPNTGKALSIVVIPNMVGYQQKFITLKVCPQIPPPTDDEHPNLRQIVDSVHMVTDIQIKYQCSVPVIKCDNIVTMQDHLYAGEWYDFDMKFDNHSNIGGFFYYDIIPDSYLGTMRFLNKKWKYFIGPNSKTIVPCSVKFTKLGDIVLAGLIKFVGVYAGYPFHIKSIVIPPKVRFSPCSIVKTIEVLDFFQLHVYIENSTPTTTWFKLNLKDESPCIFLNTYGGRLAPTGQATYTTLDIHYRDPGTYKNILYIIMEFETIEKIPITIHVKGMPLFFEPEITIYNLNIGYVLCNTEEDFHEDRPNCSKAIKVINKGLRSYRILITRTKCSAKPTCTAIPSKAKISIKRNNLIISSLSEEYFTIFINCCEETTIYNEFRIDIIDMEDPKRIKSERFVLTATFIFPQLTWNRRNVAMTYHRTHKYNEHPQWEMIKLTNIAENYMDIVTLKLTGPFKIKELFEHQFLKELEFPMVGSETKEFFIMLDKELIRNRLNTFYDGRLTCYANSKQQKSVNLKVKMYIPTLAIKQNNVVLFTKNAEGGTYIELINSGQIKAIYKWKKLAEEWCYIKEEDDTHQVAEIILSDIIRMLDLDPINFEDDSEPNMTLRFQKLKCALKHLDDPIDVKDILNDILNNLDLMGRRYKLDLHLETPAKADCIKKATKTLHEIVCIHDLEAADDYDFYDQIYEIEQELDSKTLYFNRKCIIDSSSYIYETSSSETCVYHTLEEVLGHLKLDDSFADSQPSSETCELKRSLYFFEKCGLLQEKQKEMCALHLPPVKKGFEVRASFQLDVVGGKSQVFQITLVNLDKTLTLSNDNVYLGLKPWYAQFKTKVFAENITNYQIVFKIDHVTTPQEKMPKIASGYVKVLNKKTIELPALENTVIQIEGSMGFSEEFRRELCIVINDGEQLILRLRGHGVMPMLALANRKLSLVKQKPIEVIEEYRLLQKIYYFEVFKPITDPDDDLPQAMGEEDFLNKVMSLITETPFVSTSDSKTSSESRSSEVAEKELRFFRLLKTYVLVNMNEELPNSKVLEQLVETEKFLNHLRFNTETAALLNMVHQNYLRMRQSQSDEKMPLNLKHFTIQPLPFQLKGSILKMEKIFMNQFSKFIITLEFFGPGKLIASVRSAIKIPGLVIDFDVIENPANKDFNYYRSENKFPDLSDQRYRNKKERQMDAVTDPKVKHAHSYDINKQLQHERNVLIKERKWLMNHYNSLNKSVYMEQKHHFTHCKISTNSENNFSGTKINVVILIRPQRKYYKHNQNIEDYIYIDLHMGPTLPILLHGTVIDRDQTKNSTSSSSKNSTSSSLRTFY